MGVCCAGGIGHAVRMQLHRDSRGRARVGAVVDAVLTGVGLGLTAAFVVMVLAALLVRSGL